MDINMFHVKRINEMYIRYTASDFRENDIIVANCVQYVLDNVADFEMRYPQATRGIEFHKGNLQTADPELFLEICEKVSEYLSKNNKATYSEEEIQKAVANIFG